MSTDLVIVQAPYWGGITWSMRADAWARLQARLGPRACSYQASPSTPSQGYTGASGRTPV